MSLTGCTFGSHRSDALGTNLLHNQILQKASAFKTREIPFLAIVGSMCWACNTLRDDSHTLKTCSGCWKATYCSAKCQVQHWKAEHKNQCKVLRLVGEETKQKQAITWDEYEKLLVKFPPHCLLHCSPSIIAF